MRRGFVVTLLSLSVLVGRASADVFIVNPDGSGDYRELQAAIDSVPAGSTLVVYGSHQSGSGQPSLSIDKSLTLVGAGFQPELWGGLTSGVDREPAVLAIDVGADDRVTICQLTIRGLNWGYGEGAAGPSGIRVASAGTLVVDRCDLSGGNAPGVGGDVPGPSGHGIWVKSAEQIEIFRSQLNGSRGANDCGSPYDPWVEAADGGHGLMLERVSRALVMNSSLVGGDGGDADWFDESDDLEPPDAMEPGDGGHGMVGDAFVSGSTFFGGAGGVLVWDQIDWGVGSPGDPGQPVVGTAIDLGNRISVSPGDSAGVVYLYGSGFRPNGDVAIFLDNALEEPVPLLDGWWFMTPFASIVLPLDGVGGFLVSGIVPQDPAFIGLTLYVQASDGAVLSEPEIFVFVE